MMLVKWETSPELIATRAVFTRDFCHRCSSMTVLYDIEQTPVPLNLYNGIIKMSAAFDGSFLSINVISKGSNLVSSNVFFLEMHC